MDFNSALFKDEYFDIFPVFILNNTLRLCYMNENAHRMLPEYKHGDLLYDHVKLTHISDITKLKFPAPAIMVCSKGMFMCVVSKHEIKKDTYYSVSVAYSVNEEHDITSFLSSKLAILNMCLCTSRKIRERKNLKKDYLAAREIISSTSAKAQQIELRLKNYESRTHTRQRCVYPLSETLEYILSYYKNALSSNHAMEYTVDCESISSTVTPVISLTLSFIVSIVYSFSSERALRIKATDSSEYYTVLISTKTNIKNRNADGGITVLQSLLSDFSEGVFYDYFLSKTARKNGIDPYYEISDDGYLTFSVSFPHFTEDSQISAADIFKTQLRAFMSDVEICLPQFILEEKDSDPFTA